MQTAIRADGRIMNNDAISMVHGMSRLLIDLLVLSSQLMLMSCASQRVPLSLLAETERQALGTIGIMAEPSAPEVWYSPPPFIAESGLREIQDRLHEAGQRDLEREKQGKLYEGSNNLRCHNQGCLLAVPFYLAGLMIQRGVGGDAEDIDRKTFTNTLFMGVMEKSAVQVVQDSVDAAAFSEKLRDEVWARVQKHTAYGFKLIKRSPDYPLEDLAERGINGGAQYRFHYDNGIRTLLKMRIRLIEFRGSDPDQPYRLRVHVEATLLHTDDGSYIRHDTWVYQGGSIRVAEWNKDGAKLLIDELDRGLPLIAQRVTETLFE